MIPDRLCVGGSWAVCSQCLRNVDNQSEVDPKRQGHPIDIAACRGRGYFLSIPPKSPEDKL